MPKHIAPIYQHAKNLTSKSITTVAVLYVYLAWFPTHPQSFCLASKSKAFNGSVLAPAGVLPRRDSTAAAFFGLAKPIAAHQGNPPIKHQPRTPTMAYKKSLPFTQTISILTPTLDQTPRNRYFWTSTGSPRIQKAPRTVVFGIDFPISPYPIWPPEGAKKHTMIWQTTPTLFWSRHHDFLSWPQPEKKNYTTISNY